MFMGVIIVGIIALVVLLALNLFISLDDSGFIGNVDEFGKIVGFSNEQIVPDKTVEKLRNLQILYVHDKISEEELVAFFDTDEYKNTCRVVYEKALEYVKSAPHYGEPPEFINQMSGLNCIEYAEKWYSVEKGWWNQTGAWPDEFGPFSIKEKIIEPEEKIPPKYRNILGSDKTHADISVKLHGDTLDSSAQFHFDSQCLFFDNRNFCTNDDYTLKFFIDGKQVHDIVDYEIMEDDRILIVYGSETPQEIEEYLIQLDSP